MSVVVTARTPGPIVVVVNPAAVVVRSPAPWFIANPGPAVWPKPRPASITVRRPVVVIVDDCYVRAPDPAIVVSVRPVAVSIQIFRAPNSTVIVLSVVTHPLREVTFAIVNPVVPRIVRCGGEQLPITGVRPFVDEFCGAAIA